MEKHQKKKKIKEGHKKGKGMGEKRGKEKRGRALLSKETEFAL